MLGCVPALVGKDGSVRKLVEIAHQNGFFWGGHFTRLDGMHWEIAKLIP
jgi:predicted lactoylglutathione lyase